MKESEETKVLEEEIQKEGIGWWNWEINIGKIRARRKKIKLRDFIKFFSKIKTRCQVERLKNSRWMFLKHYRSTF